MDMGAGPPTCDSRPRMRFSCSLSPPSCLAMKSTLCGTGGQRANGHGAPCIAVSPPPLSLPSAGLGVTALSQCLSPVPWPFPLAPRSGHTGFWVLPECTVRAGRPPTGRTSACRPRGALGMHHSGAPSEMEGGQGSTQRPQSGEDTMHIGPYPPKAWHARPQQSPVWGQEAECCAPLSLSFSSSGPGWHERATPSVDAA